MRGAFDLAGQSAIVTGGNKGIGLGIATALAQSGANIAILCRNMEDAKNAEEAIESCGPKAESFFCDVTDLKSVRKAVADVYDSFGEINILVNNSGVSTRDALLDMDEELSEWRRVVDTDLNGVAYMTYEVGKRMRDGGKGGCVINITSVSGMVIHRGSPRSPYNAAKAGVNHFTRAMALELGEYNIRVNAIAPGFINAGLTAGAPREFITHLEDRQSLDRLAEAIEVGALAVFLASPAAASITGTVQVIDGGLSFVSAL